MFSHLSDLSFNRTPLQAVGFYIVYFVSIMIIASILGAITEVGVDKNSTSFGNGVRLGMIFSISASIVLSFMILKAKHLTGTLGLSLLAIASGALALIGGGFLGAIIPAILTTKSKKKK